MNFKEAHKAFVAYVKENEARQRSKDFKRGSFKNRILKIRRSQPNPKTGGWFVSPNGLPENSGRRFDEAIDLETFLDLEIDNRDRCYFERGHIYNFAEYTVTIDNLTFGSYGSGARPIFRGSDTLAAATWTSETGGYYSTPLATPPLWVFNPTGEEARQGESDFLQVVSKTNDTTLVGVTAVLQAFNAVESLVGAKLRGKEFDFRYSWEDTIATYNGTDTITLTVGNTGFADDTGFRLYGQKQFATLEGDWWYDTVNAELWIKTASDPTGLDWRVCTEDKAFFLDQVTGTTITGIEFTQYFATAIETFRAPSTTISDFYIHDVRTNGLMLYGNSTNLNVSTGEITRMGLNGIHVGAISSSTFDSLDIHDIGMRPNYGWPYDTYWRKTGGTAIAIFDDQNQFVKLPISLTVTNSQLYNVAYSGVQFYGPNHYVQHVLVDTFSQRFMDAGGIHTFYRNDLGAGESTSGILIENCVVRYGIGSTEGLTNWGSPVTVGIYFDYGTNNCQINECMIHNCSWRAIIAQWNTEQTSITDCIIAKNSIGPVQVLFYEIPSAGQSPNFLRNKKNVFTGNTVVSAESGTACVGSASDGISADAAYNPFDTGGSTDNNTYFSIAKQHTSSTNPVGINSSFRHNSNAAEFFSLLTTTEFTNATFATWKTRTGGDALSTANGYYLDNTGWSDDPDPLVAISNPSATPLFYDLPDGIYNDIAGNPINDITIPGWSMGIAVIKSTYYYLMDSFTGTAGTTITGRVPTIGNTANVISGTHTIGSTGVIATSADGLITWDTGQDDYEFELFSSVSNVASVMRADVRLADNTASSTHRLILDFSGGNIRLREYDGSATPNNTWTAAFTLAINTPYRIQIICNGTNVRVRVNSVEYLNQTTTVTTGGWAGVFGQTTRSTSVITAYPAP